MNYIKKLNKYLIEHFPTIWNTRLVWMVGIAMLVHIVFFIMGYTSVNSQKDIASRYSLESFYFSSSVVFIGILTSIIIILIWIIYYLKNNAFKNLYRLKKGTLFLQFSIIIFIIFINITQFYSFSSGLKLKIKSSYDWEVIDKDIKEFNKLSVFLLKKKSEYRIDHKMYPAPFPLESSDDKYERLGRTIDTTKAYFLYRTYYYQFYKLDHDKIAEDLKEKPYKEINESHNFAYREVFDVKEYKHLIAGSLLNYSGILFRHGQDDLEKKERIQFFEEQLNKRDENVIKENINAFYKLAQKYDIKHNLNTKDWLSLINTENNYLFKEPILDYKPSDRDKERLKEDYYRTVPTTDTVSLLKRNKKELMMLKRYPTTKDGNSVLIPRSKLEYFSEIPYCDLGRLDYFFKNTHEAYFGKPQKEILYGIIIISLVIGLLLFLFKVTDIKTILLSIVSGSVLLVIITILIEYLSYFKDYVGKTYIEITVFLIFGLGILTASIISFRMRWNKLITAILFSLAVFIIPLIFVALTGLYSRYIRDTYEVRKDEFLIWFDDYGFWVVILIWILCIALFTAPIRKWKGLPK